MDNNNDYEELIQKRQRERLLRKKKRLRNQRMFYGAIAVFLMLLIVLIFKSCGNGGETTPDPSGSVSPSAAVSDGQIALPTDDSVTSQAPVNTDVTTVKLAAVGDIMAYDSQLEAALDSATGVYDFSSSFENVKDYLSAADLTVGTLETTLSGTDVGYAGNVKKWNAPEALAYNLSSVGFDILDTAETFSLQQGIQGLLSTIKNIRAAGIDNVGTYYTQEERDQSSGVVVKDINGIKIAFLAYTKGTNSIPVPDGYGYSVNLAYNDYLDDYNDINSELILGDIQAAKDLGADVIVTMMHWGDEFSTEVTSQQNELADLLFKNGVDIIIGSHPHVLQSMEKRTVTTTDGTQKEVFICYSLGNFISDLDKDHTLSSVILNINIDKDNKTGAISIGDVSYVPIYSYDKGEGTTNRFTVLDIRKAIEDYDKGVEGSVDAATYAKLKAALEDIHTLAGSELDVINLQSGTTTGASNTATTGANATNTTAPQASVTPTGEASPAVSSASPTDDAEPPAVSGG